MERERESQAECTEHIVSTEPRAPCRALRGAQLGAGSPHPEIMT